MGRGETSSDSSLSLLAETNSAGRGEWVGGPSTFSTRSRATPCCFVQQACVTLLKREGSIPDDRIRRRRQRLRIVVFLGALAIILTAVIAYLVGR